MSSAGTILDMIKRMKANRALQIRNRKDLTSKKLGMIDNSKNSKVYNSDKFKPKSEEEMKELKTKLKLAQRKDRIQLILVMFLVVMALILALMYLA